jgi:hypothetical protein
MLPFRFQAGPNSREQAAALTELSEAVARLLNFRTTPPLMLSRNGGGFSLTADLDPPFPARIDSAGTDGSGHAVYAWTEMEESVGGTYVVKAGGRTGTTTADPLYERNLTAGVTADGTLIVLAYRACLDAAGAGQEYVFDASGGTSGILVEDVDGVPSLTCTTLQFDQADGYVISQPVAGTVRLDFAVADQSTIGTVSTTTQRFAGEKRFQDKVVVNYYPGATPTLTELWSLTGTGTAGSPWLVLRPEDPVGAATLADNNTAYGAIRIANGATINFCYSTYADSVASNNDIQMYQSGGHLFIRSTGQNFKVDISNGASGAYIDIQPDGGGGNAVYKVNGTAGVTGTYGGLTFTGGLITAASGSPGTVTSVTAGTGLTNSGTSTAPILNVSFGTTSTTACVGNDSRLSDTRTPTDGSVTAAKLASTIDLGAW